MTLYVVTNRANGKQYVGQTTRAFEDRWAEHLKAATSRSDRGCRALSAAIRKYGANGFTLEATTLPVGTSQQDLDAIEIATIAYLNSLSPAGYNLRPGGRGGRLHHETKQKISESRYTAWRDPNYRARMSAAFSAAFKGVRKRPSHVAAVAAALRGRPKSAAHIERMRANTIAQMADPARRQRISQAARMRFADPEERRKASERQKGKRHSPETLQKISAAARLQDISYLNTPEVIARRRGRTCGAETRSKLAAAARNISDETRVRMSAAQRQRPPISEATREKMRAARKQHLESQRVA